MRKIITISAMILLAAAGSVVFHGYASGKSGNITGSRGFHNTPGMIAVPNWGMHAAWEATRMSEELQKKVALLNATTSENEIRFQTPEGIPGKIELFRDETSLREKEDGFKEDNIKGPYRWYFANFEAKALMHFPGDTPENVKEVYFQTFKELGRP